MSTPILLPKLGFSMTEGALAEWAPRMVRK
jgi:pyruvate/2-oxoglutarate dehydrogenase complex dihydrolipoamide acyltransferase (E2) component